jgi:membrane AbrB-like protein
VLLCVTMLVLTTVAATYLVLVHRWDAQTALFAAVPGSLSQVSAMAADRQADLGAIIVVQTIRVIALAVGVPLGLTLAGFDAPGQLPGSARGILDAPGQLAALVAGSVAAAFAFWRIGFTGGFFFGPMVVSAFLHGGGFVEVNLPGWMAVMSMIALGAINGSRFNQTSFRMLLDYLVAALGSLAVVTTVAAVFVLLAWKVFALDFDDLVASYAPGSVDVMMILALALHLDPVFIGAHHLARILVLSLMLPVGARLTDKTPLHHHELPAPLEAARDVLED